MAIFDPTKGFVEEPQIDAQVQSLAARRKLLEAMQGQNLGSQIAGRNPLAQVLMKLGTTYLQKGTAEKYQKEQAALDAQQMESTQQNLGAYLDMRQGRPGETLDSQQAAQLMQNNDPTAVNNLKDPVAANPREAIVRAMASRDPALRAIGTQDFAQLGKTPAKDFTEHVIDGKLVRAYADGRPPQVVGDYGKPQEQWKEVMIPGPDGRPLKAQQNTATGKIEVIDKGVRVTQTVNGDKMESEADKATAKLVAPKIEEAAQRAEKALNGITTAERITELSKDPEVITGFGANALTGVASLAAKLGFTGPEGVTKTQELLNQTAKQVLDAQQLLKGSTTEKDILFLQDAASGRLTYTADALQRIAGLAKAAAFNEYRRAQQLHNSARRLPGGENAATLIPFPNELSTVLDPKEFDTSNPNRVRYIGGGAAGTPQPGAAAPARSKAPRVTNW